MGAEGVLECQEYLLYTYYLYRKIKLLETSKLRKRISSSTPTDACQSCHHQNEKEDMKMYIIW